MKPAITRRHALGTLAASTAAVAGFRGFAAEPPGADKNDRAQIARVEAYLNDVRTLESRFIQTSSSGGFAEGKVYLERPGRLRLDYAPPSKLQVYADGFWLIYVDHELQNVSQVPLSSTPAAVLVADKVRLSGDLTVTQVARHAAFLRLRLVQTKEPEAGSLVLGLSDSPLQLRDWTVVDAQGVQTRVALVNPAYNAPVERSVFFFDPPPWARVPEQRE